MVFLCREGGGRISALLHVKIPIPVGKNYFLLNHLDNKLPSFQFKNKLLGSSIKW